MVFPSSWIELRSAAKLAFLSAGLLGYGLFGSTRGQPPTPSSEISQWLEPETVGVVRCDVERLSRSLSPDQVQQFMDQVGLDAPTREAVNAIEQRARRWLTEFRDAGGRELWILLNPADLTRGSPLIIVRRAPDGSTDQFRSWMEQQRQQGLANDWQFVAHDANTWLIGHNAVLERVGTGQRQPVNRAELAGTLATEPECPLVAAFALGLDQRRVVRETFPALPEPWRDLNGELLADGVRWSLLCLDPSSKTPLRIVVQARDHDVAERIEQLLQLGLRSVSELPELAARMPQIALLPEMLPLQVREDQVRIDLPMKAVETSLMRLFTEPVMEARRSAQRMQCMNHLKQIGLAMHTYYSEKKTFPPAASQDDAGKPLLSWRVHLLPYLGEKSLYEQFHLEEAWDSEHNQKLIAKMPRAFICPAVPGRQDGKTIYVLPIGPGTVWGGEQPLSLREIRDGTSQTVMVLEADFEHAVVWTKPDDLPVRPDAPGASLGRDHGEGPLALFCDGSVRLLSGDLPAESLWMLLDANDGQVVQD